MRSHRDTRRVLTAALIIAFVIMLVLALNASAAHAHYGITHAKARNIVTGVIADFCPGGPLRSRICYWRQTGWDLIVFRDGPHCFRMSASHTHYEGAVPRGVPFWRAWAHYRGSTIRICHGSFSAPGSVKREW